MDILELVSRLIYVFAGIFDLYHTQIPFQFYGVRKTKPSELRRAGRYDAPLTGKEEEKRKQNWLDGKLFSQRQYESWRENSGFNKKRHR